MAYNLETWNNEQLKGAVDHMQEEAQRVFNRAKYLCEEIEEGRKVLEERGVQLQPWTRPWETPDASQPPAP